MGNICAETTQGLFLSPVSEVWAKSMFPLKEGRLMPKQNFTGFGVAQLSEGAEVTPH
jgi:hypothetical protein